MGLTFDEILQITLKFEGGYVNHPSDPGGETNHGITKRVAERYGYHGSMKELPLSIANDIYYQEYFLFYNIGGWPSPVNLLMFDMSVNHGNKNALRILQRALSVNADGYNGPVTQRAVQNAAENPQTLEQLIVDITMERIFFYQSIAHWNTFKRGWTRRALIIQQHALEAI